MAQNEPFWITKAPILKTMIIQGNGELGVSSELASDVVDAVNTINTTADHFTSYFNYEVDNIFTIVNDLKQ